MRNIFGSRRVSNHSPEKSVGLLMVSDILRYAEYYIRAPRKRGKKETIFLNGYCEHGILQASLVLDHASVDEITEFAHTWRVEKSRTVSMDGQECLQCRSRFESNMRIIESDLHLNG
jgi:hypothetical protein